MRDNQSTTDGSKADAANKSQLATPTISLPKGGGAIRGIGEKFAANPVTGTGSMSVPIATSPGRSGFGPQLSLAYDSGAGNGPFGFGWQLSIPSITRKTDKGLPRYRDEEDSDTFILSGAEDLVPVLNAAGQREKLPRKLNGMDYTVERYRPRIEGLFARIEQWRANQTGRTHWRSISKDNITSIYGASQDSNLAGRIANPDASSHIFSWLLEMSYDDKGNVIVYEYKAEDQIGVTASLHEQNRKVTANRYLKRIKYGSHSPYYPDHASAQPTPLPSDWHFQIAFDYGEHDSTPPQVEEDTFWSARPDAFSSYRAGFEIRTYRLCQRVLMFHHFGAEVELGSDPCLVRSTDFVYSYEKDSGNPLNPIYSFLTSVTQTGSVKQANGDGYDSKSLPPLEFVYTEAKINEEVHFVDPASLENLPSGADGAHYQWLDLDSEGLPGILTEQGEAWFYKRNLSNLPTDGHSVSARFEAMELVATKPSIADLRSGQQLMDLAGDGQLCLVQFSQPMAGFYERDPDGQWQPFTPFAFSPNVAWSNPNLKSIDLNGDGHADILISEDEVFTWYPSRAQEGFGPAETVRKAGDEDKGPTLVFADGAQSIYLADLSGDGLTDLVRIRNGEVCYWPNLGYGRFGAKITMDNAPVFDYPDQFDQQRIRLADIDGSGTTDIIYLGRDQVMLYFNQSGNSWSAGQPLAQFPAPDTLASVVVVDLLGNGTACLIWSSPLPGDAVQPMCYIDLMGGQKPHLLVSVKNNLGAETKAQYAASTHFYLQDRAAGDPWITKLPFPVHVVERVETYDYVSKTKFVSLYQYHHGYFDGVEREFRGFGMVEQFDTESFSKFSGAGLFTETPETAGEEFHLPPVHTKIWFHNGAYIAQDNISRHFEDEYYRGDPLAKLLPDTILPGGLTAQEQREACRALKGRILRQEIYADDGSEQAAHPYSATEHTYHLRLIQPLQGNRHAVFYAYECEALAYHYERNPQDPRLSHQMTLEVDKFGNVLKAAAIGYPRRPPQPTPDEPSPPPHPAEQTQTLITYTENQVVNKPNDQPNDPDWYRLGVPIEMRTYELTGFSPSAGAIYTPSDFIEANQDRIEVRFDHELAYEKAPTSGRERRLIERVRTLYLNKELSGPLPLGEVESLALPYESYKMAFTPGLLEVYQSKISKQEVIALLKGEGKYKDLDTDGVLWIPSGRAIFSADPAKPDAAFARNHFYSPQGSQDPFGNLSRLTYDAYDLLIVRTEDALGNIVTAENDYRVMQPDLVTDPNGNRAAVRFDALGMLVATAVMGKAGQNEGDTLDDPTSRLEYDLFNWVQNKQPVFVHTFAREQHGSANPRWQESRSYSDGVGREVMKKIQAEPGQVKQLDEDGNIIEVDTSPEVRWVGTGRVVFDNKGHPVKKYEPFFSATPEYETEEKLVVVGVTPILRYDPLGRLIRTDLPNGTFSKVEFDPWRQITSDENDTILESRWYDDRGSPAPAAAEPSDPDTRAAWLAAKHADTPTVTHLDTLGRPFLAIADNGRDKSGVPQHFKTRTDYDIEGKPLAVIDALNRVVMEYRIRLPQTGGARLVTGYDVAGNPLYQNSMDAGERWVLHDVTGQPIRRWDSRDHEFNHTYDPLRRPTEIRVKGGVGLDNLYEKIIYGEGQSLNGKADTTLNLRGKPFAHYDTAGKIRFEAYDFKGNVRKSRRWLTTNYKDVAQWDGADPDARLESEDFPTETEYDALNRVVWIKTPDGSITRPRYNEANLLEAVEVEQEGTTTAFVTDINYNEKGQRLDIAYGNGVKTSYSYELQTFRLLHLETRQGNGELLQDLRYTYDPVGNITQIEDRARPTIFFGNMETRPVNDYAYDPLYRLTQAQGREHIAQVSFGSEDNWHDGPFLKQYHANDPTAWRTYTQQYQYDAVGNITQMKHIANGGDWTRDYAYETANNRLKSTVVGADTYTYSHHPQHGFMTGMPHLQVMAWNFRDELQAVARQRRTDGGQPETTYYVYDASGQRVRKITEKAAGPGETPVKMKERLYLGSVDIYREYTGANAGLERQTLQVMDDTRRIALVETRNDVDDGSPKRLVRYQFDNHLGSASLELDDLGAVISYEEYHPYGTTSYQAVDKNINPVAKRYRYTGKERDEESGLYYYGARYYAPWLRRWVSCDPVFLSSQSALYTFVSCNPITHFDVDGRYDPSAFGKSLEAKITQAENALLLEDRNIGTSLVNTTIATASTVAKGFLSILQVGTGAAQGWEDIKRGWSDKGDAWDYAIGVSRILSDAGEIASTALAVAGTSAKVAKTGQIALIKREIKIVQAQRQAATGQNAVNLSEKLGELSAKKEFIAAGYQNAGNLKRIPNNGGNVRQGVDQGYRNMKPFRGKEAVVEAKGLSKPPAQANQARALKTDTQGLVEGAENWNLNRLQDAANSGNKNAQGMLKRLAGDTPESFLSVTNSGTGQTTVSQLQGAVGRPIATPLVGLGNVSPVGEMMGATVIESATRNLVH